MARGFAHGLARYGGGGQSLGRDMARSRAARGVLGGVLVVAVLIMWAVIASAVAQHVVLTTRGVQVEAEVIGYEHEQNVRRPTQGAWRPVYRFTTTSGAVVQLVDTRGIASDTDVERTVWNPDERMWQVPRAERARVVVVYDPTAPEVFQRLTELEAGVGVTPWGLGIVSLVLAAGAVALFAWRPRSTPPADPLPRPRPRDELTREAAETHRLWVRDGRRGEGRLDVVGYDARERRLDVLDIPGVRLTEVNLWHSTLEYSTLDDAVVTDCNLRGANVIAVRLHNADVIRCSFENTHAMRIDLMHARVSDSTFAGALLDKSRWVEARCHRTSFRGAQFGNSLFDNGKFVDCDFREASFRPTTILPPVTMVGAVFEGCDFRSAYLTRVDLTGATFRACRFHGAYGIPAASAGLTVIDCDVSPRDDTRTLVDADALLRLLATRSTWPVVFRETGDPRYPFAADDIEGQTWTVRLDDFPNSTSLYTLLVDGKAIETLQEWPAAWQRSESEASSVAPRTSNAHDSHEREALERELAHYERTRHIPPREP